MEHLAYINDQRRQIEEQRRQIEAGGEVRKRVQELASHVAPTNGDDRDQLRQWIHQIDQLRLWTNAQEGVIIDLSGQLSRPPLSTAILAIREGLQAGFKTWPNVKAAIEAQFLEVDEQGYLHARLDRLVQQPMEDIRGYSRRFRTQLEMAYPAEEREVPSVRNRLIRLFISGISSETVRQQVS